MKNITYSEDENTLWIDGVEYHATESKSYGCYECDIYKLVGERFCDVEHCISYDRKDHREFIIWKQKKIKTNENEIH